MPSYLQPGVYIEEVSSGSRPIEGVATSTAAFVGVANRGPVGEPTLIGSFDDYIKDFGKIIDEDDSMGLAVQAFYLNGGGSAYICRLAGDVASAENETDILGEGAYSSGTNSRTATASAVLNIKASSPGIWANDKRFKIVKDYRDARLFSLLLGRLDAGEFKEEERFDSLSMDPNSDDYVVNVVKQNSSLINIAIADPLAFQNAQVTGATVNYTTDIAPYVADATKTKSFMISINGSQAKNILIPPGADVANKTKLIEFIQQQIRAAIGSNSINVSSQGTNTAGNFIIESVDTFNVSDSVANIQLIDSPFLEVLGLSSKNKASITGTDAGASPSVSSGDAFQIELDAFTAINIEFPNNIDGGAAIATEIKNLVRASGADNPSFASFDCEFNSVNNSFTLTSGAHDVLESGISLVDGTGTPLDSLKLAVATTSVIGRTIQQGVDPIVPQMMLGSNPAVGFGERLQNGENTTPIATDFTSFYNTTLRKFRDVSIIVTPGSSWDGGVGQSNLAASLAHCESMKNRVLIIDPPINTELENANAVNNLGLPTSTYSVLYYPWVSMSNPLYHPDKAPNKDKNVLVAPSAIAAGMWAKIDGKRGVWKAPAGVEARVTGATGLEYVVENLEQAQLNPLGVNCIRKLPNYGSVFWGARSLATKADPEWRYVPVRRTAIYIEESIYNGIQWAVFEPNSHPLWSSLRANIGSFMNGMFRAGAFQGETSSQAFFVRCGLGDTMTQGDIDRGQVIVTVGFAPLKPAEFVIVRIQQKVGEEQ
ncbi:phage tail sheath family protein [sulfur-oxidizing endosymbiont of Gigantopelta aegis]|uniref:phage tail sheath family protein n=1 Tax=sulfur-oxidizing endosymbiont of Gigantopelta aegis TaxID=2794934 RepID=UPI001FE5F963|nr:phage tail sheath C-terminal domain-containing protein [sulfur-oxidizing endosymbiont of Gigantopelta aegis]